ncbi:MAG: hypothetical protein LKF98_04255 [Microbacteriaceae bacterium]|jgi:Tfp pilus assembly protein PilO|nr:hypothetical protein [Microbacteriaceae bacterium]
MSTTATTPRLNRSLRRLLVIGTVSIITIFLLLLILIPSRGQVSQAKQEQTLAAQTLKQNRDRLTQYQKLLRTQTALEATSAELTTQIPAQTDQQGALLQISAAAGEANVEVTNVTWQTPVQFKQTLAKQKLSATDATSKKRAAALRAAAADPAFKAIPVQVQTTGSTLDQSKNLIQNLQGMQRLFWVNQVQTTTSTQQSTNSSSSGGTTGTTTVQTTVNGYLFSYKQ